MSVYLDYNATAKVRPEAAAAMARALEISGNPSSVHAAGRAARAIVEDARAEVATLVAAKPPSVVFVSGGAEASALAIGSAVAAGFDRILVGATEHDVVLENVRVAGLPFEIWPVDGRGLADLDWLEDRLRSGPRALVCLMAANNETGVIQPVAEAATLVRAADGWLHVDAVQAAGKIALDFTALGADTLALSAHKIGGPQGVGALVAGPRATLSRRLHGGGQERGRRAAGFAHDRIPFRLARRPSRRGDARRRRAAGRGRATSGADARVRHPRLFLRATGDGAGPSRRHGQRRRGLFVRQGQAQPRCRGDGPAGPRALRDPRQRRLGDHGGRLGPLRRGLD
jgi:selenocysteine lyase/cysteine desulfurase